MTYTPPPRPLRERFIVRYRDARGLICTMQVHTTGEAAARLIIMRAEDIPASNIIEVTRSH